MTTSHPTNKKRVRGPNDPDRRNRIARAAITVVAEQGIDALTHRAVAAAAGVPLGSTTYHFATLSELLSVALDEAANSSIAQLRRWEEHITPGRHLATALADFVVDSLGTNRQNTMAEYNLYALALHRPHLRSAAAAWDDALAELFGAHSDPLTGRMIAALFCGLLMQAVLSDNSHSHGEIEAIFQRAIGS